MISPLYGQLSPLRVPTTDIAMLAANAYIAAVEAADGQSLESGVKSAFTDFIVGCHNDGIWSALKASCILAGARTLSGALVPLVGTAPTNANFVSGDYNRELGLKGNQSTKYLNSNQPENTASDSINSFHLSINATLAEASSNLAYIGAFDSSITPNASSAILTNIRLQNRGDVSSTTFSRTAGFHGTSRNGSSINFRSAGTTESITSTPNAETSLPIYVFARNANSSAALYCDPRISFYSIGGTIDLSLLDTRVSTLMTDLAAAI